MSLTGPHGQALYALIIRSESPERTGFEAYRLECSVAHYPRIVFEQEVLDVIQADALFEEIDA